MNNSAVRRDWASYLSKWVRDAHNPLWSSATAPACFPHFSFELQLWPIIKTFLPSLLSFLARIRIATTRSVFTTSIFPEVLMCLVIIKKICAGEGKCSKKNNDFFGRVAKNGSSKKVLLKTVKVCLVLQLVKDMLLSKKSIRIKSLVNSTLTVQEQWLN